MKRKSAKRVLVADNSPLVLEYMEQVLTEAGCDVTTVPDGLRALKVIDSVDPDILFTDIIMPYIDGIRLTRVLRSRERYRNLYVVALSAIASESDLDLAALQIDLGIAKGPLREMSVHVLAALKESDGGRRFLGKTPVIGLEGVHSRQITRELLSEISRYKVLADSLSDGVLAASEDGLVVTANKGAERILGMTEEQLLGVEVDSLGFTAFDESVGSAAHTFPEEKEGTLLWLKDRIILRSVLPVSDSVQDLHLIMIRDVTDVIKSRQKLHEALEDRDLLLREVHHRVKNNLATISSLISLQMSSLPRGDTRDALSHLRAQIESIGLVHDHIYHADTVSTVQFKDYAQELLGNLIHLHGADRRVKYAIDGPALELKLATAIPLGLSLSELIINSLKHGFPDERHGKINIRLMNRDSTQWLVEYKDDGVGLPSDLESRKTKTLGIRLLTGLAHQLRGTIDFPESPDRTILLVFDTEPM